MAVTSSERRHVEGGAQREFRWAQTRLRLTAVFFAYLNIYPLQGCLRALADRSAYRLGRALLLGVIPFGGAAIGLWSMRIWGWWFGAVLAASWVIDYSVRLIRSIGQGKLETVVLGLLFIAVPLSIAGGFWGIEVTERIGLKPERRVRTFLVVCAFALAYWAVRQLPLA